MRLEHLAILLIVQGLCSGTRLSAEELKGSVQDIEGGKVDAGEVILRSADSGQQVGRSSVTPSGTYRFANVAAGAYSLTIKALGYSLAKIDGIELREHEEKVLPVIALDTGPHCDTPVMGRLVLLANQDSAVGTLRGSVVFQGSSVPDTKVLLLCGKSTCGTVTTDTGGHYSFQNLQAGIHSLVFEKRGFFRDTFAPFVVQAGFEADYRPIELEKCGTPNCRTNRKSRRRWGPCD
jgi:hypothetical protein